MSKAIFGSHHSRGGQLAGSRQGAAAIHRPGLLLPAWLMHALDLLLALLVAAVCADTARDSGAFTSQFASLGPHSSQISLHKASQSLLPFTFQFHLFIVATNSNFSTISNFGVFSSRSMISSGFHVQLKCKFLSQSSFLRKNGLQNIL